eukprot:694336-Amphidinium_carterae.1
MVPSIEEYREPIVCERWLVWYLIDTRALMKPCDFVGKETNWRDWSSIGGQCPPRRAVEEHPRQCYASKRNARHFVLNVN